MSDLRPTRTVPWLHLSVSFLISLPRQTLTLRLLLVQVLDFVKQFVPEPNTAQLAGNSVHVDRMFLVKHMPNFIAHLNYRIVDVSSVKELARRWFPYVSHELYKAWLELLF